jgi:hypothetical protein
MYFNTSQGGRTSTWFVPTNLLKASNLPIDSVITQVFSNGRDTTNTYHSLYEIKITANSIQLHIQSKGANAGNQFFHLFGI